jgi:glycosyltransferase involved in cell wall biosynthesis
MNKKLGIINASAYFQDQNGECYMQPSELKSLEMFDFFKKVILYKPRVNSNQIPKGWVRITNGYECREICDVNTSRLKRRRIVQSNIKQYINDVDIFYFRMPNYEASWAWEIIRKYNVPFFTELHGDWEEAILSEDNNSFLRKISREYRSKKASSIVMNMVKESQFVMTIGHKLTKYIKDENKPILVTTNHLLDEQYYTKTDKKLIEHNIFKILFVGDIQVRKGMMYLFKAFKMLVDDGLNVHLDIVGSGASESILKDFTKSNNLDKKITFHGRVPHGPLLFDYFKNANVFILPSVGAEGVPRVTHEAMAMSCPVIATDVGSVAWQLQKDSGILIPPKDEKSIYLAVKNLIKDPDKYQKLVKNGYDRSLEFTYKKQKESIQKFIIDQIDENKTN